MSISGVRRKSKAAKQKPLSWYKKELDRVFSVFIRLRDNGVCYTCGDKKSWKYQQAGHYVSRIYLSVRWNEKNVHCQCPGCNVFKHGNMDEYTLRLISQYGSAILEELNKDKWKPVKLDRAWYEDMISHYKITIIDRWKLKV